MIIRALFLSLFAITLASAVEIDAAANQLRDQIAAAEQVVDQRFQSVGDSAPMNVMGNSRGAYIEGRLQMDTWDDKQTGQKRSKLKVVAESLQFLPDGKGGAGGQIPQGGAQSSRPPQQQNRPQGASAAPAEDYGDEDDIPF